MKQLHIGITGSRDGITQAQIEAFVTELSKYDEIKLHNGDCVGEYGGIHKILLDVKKENPKVIEIYIHPPTDNKQRAFCQKKYETKDVLVHSFVSEEYLKGNQKIVSSAKELWRFRVVLRNKGPALGLRFVLA